MYIPEQTSGTKIEITDYHIRNWYWILEYGSPVAKERKAKFSPTLKGFRKRVHFIPTMGVTRRTHPSNVSMFLRR